MYRKGTLNPADGLSRRPDYKELVKERDQTVFPTLLKKFQLWQARVDRSDFTKKPTVTNITIAILTRKAAAGTTPSIPFLPGNTEIASGTHAQRTETESDTASNLNKKSLLKTTRNIALTLPKNTTHATFQGTSDYEILTNTIINLLLSLQANDNWNKGKA
jgi:hypothetical protein